MYPTVLFGPDSLPYNTSGMTALSPAPPNTGVGGMVAQRYKYPMGQQLILQDGRKYRFGVAGGSTLVIGDVVCGPVATASSQNLTAAANAIGQRFITLTTAASTAVNTFAEGYASVSVTPGAGNIYKIASHATFTSGAGDVVNLAPGHGLRVALTTTSRVDLYQNKYDGLLQAPATTLASAVAGVALTAPLTRVGCWVQTRGMASVLGTGTLIAGTRAIAGSAAGGAVAPETATEATSAIEVTIGVTFFAAATEAWSGIFLKIDG